jgi:hypothetical protein
LTQLSGQTPGSSLVSKDTSLCYTAPESRAIAQALIRGTECDTLLKIANRIIAAQNTAIVSLQTTINKQDLRYSTTEKLVTECVTQKEVLKKDLKKAKRKLIWTKIGWAATAVILTTTTILALIL